MPSIADSRWRVLPVGPLVALRRTAVDAVLHGLIGLLGLFVVAVVSGLVVEELLPETDTATSLDLVARASLVGDLLLGLIGLLALGLLGALEGPLMARALARAAQQGNPATDVPIPAQWEAAQESSARAYRVVAIVLLVILGFFYLILVVTVLGDPDPGALAILGGGALLLAVIWAGIPLTGRLLPRWQSRHAGELGQRWTPSHRIIAAGRALTAEDISAQRAEAGIRAPLPGRGVRALRQALLVVVALAAAAWVAAFQLLVVVAYPEATYGAGRQLGERTELDPAGERLVDLLTAGEGISAALGAAAFAAVVVCEIVLRRAEHRALRRALADPAGPPPHHALLTRAMAGTSLPALKVLFALTGSAAALGVGLWFVDLVADLPDWDTYAAAGEQLRAAASLGPWIVLGALGVMGLGIALSGLLDARDRVLRDQLAQRWPVRHVEPAPSED